MKYATFSQRCLFAVSLLLLSSCGFSNLQSEATQNTLEQVLAQLEASGVSEKASEKKLDELLSRQESNNNQLVKLESELQTLHQQYLELQRELGASKEKTSELEAPVLSSGASKLNLGRVEWLWLVSAERYFAAQLRSGLDTSLVFADKPMLFERDGERWLRFSVERNDWSSELSARVERSTKIQQLDGSQLKGYVVLLGIQVADFKDEIEFLVLERQATYPQFVLGKNFLTDIALLDVSEKYLHKKKTEFIRAESIKKQAHEAEKSEIKAAELSEQSTP